jgi:hypothetical protein|tara:strand:+ start:297 stop:512 length:216 start_codon:yes stop_codon:yes gene_type:complete
MISFSEKEAMEPEESINPEALIRDIKADHDREKKISRDKAIKGILGKDLGSRKVKEVEIKDIPDDNRRAVK